MPNVQVDNEFNGNWKDYKMYSLTAPSDGRKYITGYRKSDGKQLRRYEYQREIMTDEEIPNSIDEINKIVSYKANPKEWMKLYMRARRKLDYDGGGTRDNPKPAFPDSNFQKEGVRKKGPGRARDKERDKKKLVKMRRRIKEGRIKEDKEREAQKRKYEEQYKINKIYDSYLDMLADKSEEELKEFRDKEDIKRTKKQQQNFISQYLAAEKRAKDRENLRNLAEQRAQREREENKRKLEEKRKLAEKKKKEKEDEERKARELKEFRKKEAEEKQQKEKEKREKETKEIMERGKLERAEDRRNLKQLQKEARDLRKIITDEDDVDFDLRSFGKNLNQKFSELTESQLEKHNKRNKKRKAKLKEIDKEVSRLQKLIKKFPKED